MDKKWCIVSYCTPEYRLEVLELLKSTTVLNILHSNLLIPSFGSWVKNCGFKARFCFNMFKMLDQYEAIIYIDSDAVFEKYPELFDEYVDDGVEFAAHWRRGTELLSGTLFFGRGVISSSILAEWISIQEKEPEKWDQKTLQKTILKFKHFEKTKVVSKLPMEYCKIFDAPDMECDPVIEHFQASRKLKKIVNGETK